MSEDRLRVLLAEDETIIRLDLEQMLEENGTDVVGEALTPHSVPSIVEALSLYFLKDDR